MPKWRGGWRWVAAAWGGGGENNDVCGRRPGHAEVAGSIDVGAAVVGHGEKHHAVAVNVSRLDEGLLVGFPDAVDDGRLSRISGGAMIEFAAEVDHSHGAFLPRFAVRPRSIRVVAHYSR